MVKQRKPKEKVDHLTLTIDLRNIAMDNAGRAKRRS
jgi:hypothetical protein